MRFPDLPRAFVGERFRASLELSGRVRETTEEPVLEVRATCGSAGEGEGFWICTTCGEPLLHDELRNHFADLAGNDGPDHALAWWCSRHGPEVDHEYVH